MDLELIEWYDSSSIGNGGWNTIEEIENQSDPVIVKTVGWIVKETDSYLIVVSTKTSHMASSNIQILKPNIFKRKKLR